MSFFCLFLFKSISNWLILKLWVTITSVLWYNVINFWQNTITWDYYFIPLTILKTKKNTYLELILYRKLIIFFQMENKLYCIMFFYHIKMITAEESIPITFNSTLNENSSFIGYTFDITFISYTFYSDYININRFDYTFIVLYLQYTFFVYILCTFSINFVYIMYFLCVHFVRFLFSKTTGRPVGVIF